jgi:hypothetical protein
MFRHIPAGTHFPVPENSMSSPVIVDIGKCRQYLRALLTIGRIGPMSRREKVMADMQNHEK